MKTMNCPRCDGKGHITYYGHIRDGVCFRCGGAGTVKFVAGRTQKVDAKRTAYIVDRQRKTALAVVMYENDARVRVGRDNPYFEAHCIELAELDRVWETL